MLAPVIASLFLINYVKKSRNLLKVRCGWWVVVGGGWWWSKGILGITPPLPLLQGVCR